MEENSLIYHIPTDETLESQSFSVEESPQKPTSLFEELNAISEEIEQCRQKIIA